ncbi:MAG: PQQ-binding-like beta-propeller repeat protein [Actinobacteria bacterium]|nr:PQQ-binding-like beta-propeller repeat protein [Actinomycetota bacterium]
MRLALAALAAALLPVGAQAADWPGFDYDTARSGSGPVATGITAANAGHLVRRKVQLDGTVDSAPIYLHGVTVGGSVHDVFFVTTTYGRTEAIDAATGSVLWRYVPATYAAYAGSPQITTMTPQADPSRTAIYAGEPDGRIVKLAVATGKLLWSTPITRDPTHEKLAGSINVSRGLVLAATDGYIGDAPPYQGHVVSLNATTGALVGVWNSLCSNRTGIIQPSTCGSSDSAMWGRSAPVVDPATGDLLLATGNGPWNGRTDWGDSVVVVSPDASHLLRHWTPWDEAQLNDDDQDLGSTAPALLTRGYFVQGGKDGKLRLLRLQTLPGVNAKRGGELQTISTPGGADLFSEPAVWQGTWIFLVDDAGTAAWRFAGGRLHPAWSNGNGGTSPVVAGGLVYVAGSGAIHVYVPTTGREVATLPIGEVHWQSPIVVDGRVAAAEGNSNDHSQNGVLDIYQ